METKKKEQNTKAEAETFAATVKGMNRDDQLRKAQSVCSTGSSSRFRKPWSHFFPIYMSRPTMRVAGI